MSRRGDNIRKRKDGRWEGRYIYARNDKGKALYKSVYGKTYTEAKVKLTEEIKKINISTILNEQESISDIADKWLNEIKIKKKYSTYVKYNYIYNNHIKDYLGNKKLQKINADDCIALLETESINASEPLSKSTIDSIRNVLTQLLSYGNNPIKIPSSSKLQICFKEHAKRITVFSKEEQYKLQSFLLNETDSYKLGIYICMFTGLRLGEICALKTENISLSKRIICVNQTVQRIKSDKSENKTELLIAKPKTTNSIREIPICDLLLNVLEQHMSHNTYLVNGNKVMEPRTYQYFFHRTLKTLSIEEKGFHTLRHTFATNCIDSGMEPKCLSEILGHSDIKTTLNKYVHPTFEQKIKQINSVASNYGQINGQI